MKDEYEKTSVHTLNIKVTLKAQPHLVFASMLVQCLQCWNKMAVHTYNILHNIKSELAYDMELVLS